MKVPKFFELGQGNIAAGAFLLTVLALRACEARDNRPSAEMFVQSNLSAYQAIEAKVGERVCKVLVAAEETEVLVVATADRVEVILNFLESEDSENFERRVYIDVDRNGVVDYVSFPESKRTGDIRKAIEEQGGLAKIKASSNLFMLLGRHNMALNLAADGCS